MRGANGATGAAGPAGPNGAPGASGSLSLVQRDFSNAELQALDATPIVMTAGVPGYLQILVAAGFEINKTHLSGAGAVPNWLIRYTGTATTVFGGALGPPDLGNTRNYGSWIEQATASQLGGSVGVAPPGSGLGLSAQWSASYAPSTFSGTARLSLIVAYLPLRF